MDADAEDVKRALTDVLHETQIYELAVSTWRLLKQSCTSWAIKKSQHIFVCNFVTNQRILMQFSPLTAHVMV